MATHEALVKPNVRYIIVYSSKFVVYYGTLWYIMGIFRVTPRLLIDKPLPVVGIIIGIPNIKALKRRGFIDHGSLNPKPEIVLSIFFSIIPT